MENEPVTHNPGPDRVRSRYLIDVVRDVLEDFAPEEVPLLSSLRGLDDAEVGRQLARRVKRDDPLGFGVGEVVILAAPIIWGAVQHVTNRMAESATQGLLSRVRNRLFKRFGRKQPAVPLPQLDHDELRRVRGTVVDMAKQAGMKDKRAEQLAASVVDRLVFGETGGEEP